MTLRARFTSGGNRAHLIDAVLSGNYDPAGGYWTSRCGLFGHFVPDRHLPLCQRCRTASHLDEQPPHPGQAASLPLLEDA